MLGAIEVSVTLNALQFNVVDADGNLLCPCCGMTDQFSTAAYDARGGIIGSDICGACFWEPGFDDDQMASAGAGPTIIASLLSYRAMWITSGCLWRGTTRLQPAGWDPAQNMKHLLALAPHLAGATT
jgi:hypothetical protein